MLSIIVAMDVKRGIGKNNALMWKIKGELPRFKQITTGHPIIMGRKTYESIGRPLPNRTNIVITRDPHFKVDGVEVVHSLEDALTVSDTKYHIPHTGKHEVFVIGGGQIFEQALPMADRLYLTLVKGDFGADVFFPDYSMFTKVIEREDHDDGDYQYSFLTLEK